MEGQGSHGLCVLLVLLTVAGCLASSDLCENRCQESNTDLQRLRWAWSRTFNNVNGRELTFREFIMSLVSAASKYPRLSPLRGPLLRVLSDYRDCMLACEHQFSKRDSGFSKTFSSDDPLLPICEVLGANLNQLNSPILRQFWDFCLSHLLSD